MRRWDADNALIGRRPAAVGSVLLSLLVHAGVLGLATRFALAPNQAQGIIRVALLPPGGGGGRGDTATSAPPAEPVAAVAAAPAVLAPPVKAAPRPALRRAPRPQRVAPAAADAAAAGGSVPSGGELAASGGDGGRGPGSGGGSGGGQGGGTGDGRGAGSGDDHRPYCVYCPEPDYPLVARRRGWQGTVDVALQLLADGRVERASVRQTSGHDVLDRAAVAVAQQSRFTPQGRGLEGRIEYRFELVAAR